MSEKQIALAKKIVSGSHAGDGFAPLDLERFWEDQEIAITDPFAADCPQLPLGVLMNNECVFTELEEPQNWYKLLHDDEYRVRLEREYNDRSERIVGKRLLRENLPTPNLAWPKVKKLNEIFDAPEEWHGWSYWIRSAATNPDELSVLLDLVDSRLEDLRSFILPPNWDDERDRLLSAGVMPNLYRGQRGPVTFAMSVYGVENLIYLILDNPDLAARFSDLILRAILERARIIDEEAGYNYEGAPHGWSWADDNCAMLNADMYEFFAYPIMKGVFGRYSPDSNDTRAQHSDSEMAHLLPLLGRLELTSTNFGPALSVLEIRKYLPRAIIEGQLAPFTFSRHEEINIVAETLRDFEMSKESRGVVYSTAGSINNGSRLDGLRLIMSTIQRYCRY